MTRLSGPSRQGRGAELRALLVYAAIGVVGSYVFMVLPLLIEALTSLHAFSKSQVGLLGASSLLGMFTGSVLSARILQRSTYRGAALCGAIGLTLCYFLSCAVFRNFAWLGTIQFAGGVAGTVLMSMALMAIGRTRTPDRNFAIFVVLQLSTGAVGVLLLGAITAAHGIVGAYAALAVFSLLPLGLIPFLPRGAIGASPQAATSVHAPVDRTGALLVLLGQFAFGCGVMAIWSVAAMIGSFRGWDAASVAQALSFSLLASVGGALIATLVSGRWPRLAVLCAGALILVAGAALAAVSLSFPLFVAGVACFAFAWNLMPAFQLGLAAELEGSGRLVVLSIAAVKLGYAAGVSLGGVVQGRDGFLVNALVTTAALAVSTLAFSLPLRRPAPR